MKAFAVGCVLFAVTGSAHAAARSLPEGSGKVSRTSPVEASAPATVRELDVPYIDLVPVRIDAPSSFRLRAASGAFGMLMTEAARANGYSVVFSGAIDVGRPVTANLEGLDTITGLKVLARVAGYIAIVDRTSRTVAISEVATFTYQIPSTVIQHLDTAFNVGSGSAIEEAAGAKTLAGSSGFSVQGQGTTDANSFRALLQQVAGAGVELFVSDLGIVTLRANAQVQQRVHEFLRSFVRTAMSQVEIAASIIEVTPVARRRSAEATLANPNPEEGLRASPSAEALTENFHATLGGTFSAQSIQSIIEQLRTVSDVSVRSSPRLLALNNTPATFFATTEVQARGPTMTSLPAPNKGKPVAGVDQVSFSVQPSIIDDHRVELTVLPALSARAGKLRAVKADAAIMGASANTQSFMRIMVESGQTVIVSGGRLGGALRSAPAQEPATEILILLSATILPARDIDPLIGESL